MDDQVGFLDLVGEGHLGGDAGAGLVLGGAVAGAGAADLLVGRGGDHDQGAEGVGEAVLDQQGGLVADQGLSGGGEAGDGLAGGDGDAGVGDGVEGGAAGGVGEDDGRQGFAIKLAGGGQHRGAEGLDHRRQPLGARGHDLAGHLVGVDHRHPPGREAPADRAFAAGDAARQTEDPRHGGPEGKQARARGTR